jgi:3-oxoacyl-[acyl-carrier-protein] synthase II
VSTRRRVAITGLGLVTPVGNDVASTWAALLAGRSGAARIASFDASGFPVRIAAEVKGLDDAAVLQALGGERKLLKFCNRSHRFALVAAAQAFADAGIRPTGDTATRWGCVVGTGMMGVTYDELAQVQQQAAPEGEFDAEKLLQAQGSAADPMAFCRSNSAAGASLLTRVFGIRGYSSSVHTACASGGQAVGTALKLIRRGEADCVLAGGFDSMINPVGLAGFCLLNAVSPDNDAPERASRPFDASRNGFVLGEGAGFLVLEEWQAARKRGARIYAELAGDGNSLSSYRITDSHPSGDGPIQAMRQAVADAGATLGDVNYLNAHGTSTPMNDRSEAAAVKAVWGDARGQVAVSSTKSVTGHLIAAAGAVEAAICALAIHHGTLPVNANLREPDADNDLDIVRDAPRARRVRAALSNSLGFGGSNSCLAFRHPDDVEAVR